MCKMKTQSVSSKLDDDIKQEAKSERIHENEDKMPTAINNPSFVAFKRSGVSKEQNVENISNCNTLHDVTLDRKIEFLENSDETILFGNTDESFWNYEKW